MRAARRCWAGNQSFSFRYRFSLNANWFFLPVRHQRGVKLFRISRLLKLCSYFSFYTQYIIWKFRVIWMWICDYRTKGGHLKDIRPYVQSTVQGFNEKPFKTSEKPCGCSCTHLADLATPYTDSSSGATMRPGLVRKTHPATCMDNHGRVISTVKSVSK